MHPANLKYFFLAVNYLKLGSACPIVIRKMNRQRCQQVTTQSFGLGIEEDERRKYDLGVLLFSLFTLDTGIW